MSQQAGLAVLTGVIAAASIGGPPRRTRFMPDHNLRPGTKAKKRRKNKIAKRSRLVNRGVSANQRPWFWTTNTPKKVGIWAHVMVDTPDPMLGDIAIDPLSTMFAMAEPRPELEPAQPRSAMAKLERRLVLDGFELSAEQKAALEKGASLKSGFLFITGKAGVGKSVVLRKLRELDKTIVLAPTGLAVVNVGGQTIHSFLGLRPGPIEWKKLQLGRNSKRALQAARRIVIDEVAMVRADLMDALDLALRRALQSEEPFGGMPIVAFGDVFQIEPDNAVGIGGDDDLDEWVTAILRSHNGVIVAPGKLSGWMRSMCNLNNAPVPLDTIARDGLRPSRVLTNRKSGYLSEMVPQFEPVRTPSASDPEGGVMDSQVDSGLDASGNSAEMESTDLGKGMLNAQYSRWLMGYPPIWCIAARLATRSLPKGKRAHDEASRVWKRDQSVGCRRVHFSNGGN